MFRSAWHLALDTVSHSNHAKGAPTARTFHVAFIPYLVHLASAKIQCHNMVTLSRGLLLPSGTPDAGYAGLHRLPAACEVNILVKQTYQGVR
jgi:hypothetical protein